MIIVIIIIIILVTAFTILQIKIASVIIANTKKQKHIPLNKDLKNH